MARSEAWGRKVLVVRFSALGDVAMAVPVMYDVCGSNPDVEFTMLTRGHASSLFLNPPPNLTVKGINTDDYKGLPGLRRLYGELIAEGYDSIIDLHDVIRTKVLRLFFRLGGRKAFRFHKGRRGKRALTRRNHKVLLPLPTTRSRYCEVFHRAGFARQENFLSLYGDGKGPEEAFARASVPRQEGERWVAVAPFARHTGKIYPTDLMEQVIEDLACRPGYKLFLLGAGAEELNILGRWAMRWPTAVNVAGMRLGIPAELSLLSHCDALISMDSANMHMASLVGCRTISIWGATHPYCGFMGWRQSKSDAVQLDMTCRPCSIFGNKPCFRGDYHCLRGISPRMILSRLDR